MLAFRNYRTSTVFGKAIHKPTLYTIVRAVRNYFCKSELLSYSKQLSEVQLNLLYTFLSQKLRSHFHYGTYYELRILFNTLTTYSHYKESHKVPVFHRLTRCGSLSSQANRSWAGKESPAFYRIVRFITAFTRARHLALSCANPEAFVKDLKHGRFLWGRVVSTSHNPQYGGSPPVGCPRLLIQYIRSYPPNWMPFLHPQPEDAP
jgi:hypothetical protein